VCVCVCVSGSDGVCEYVCVCVVMVSKLRNLPFNFSVHKTLNVFKLCYSIKFAKYFTQCILNHFVFEELLFHSAFQNNSCPVES